MTTTTGRWLLVILAVVGLAVAAPVVGAHGDGPTAATDRTGTATPVAGHAGPGEIGPYAGATGGEMPWGVAGAGHHHDDGQHDWAYHDGQHGDGHYHDGWHGQHHGR